MGDYKHLAIVEFKDNAAVDEILKGMEKLVSEIDYVKTFEWGQDPEGQDILRQGFTHVFLMTFRDKEDCSAFLSHPSHVGFSATFSAAIKKIVVLDFPSALVKAQAE
ncbi:stress-response A/B barrel domain-containing protein At5g22580-like [Punica granatum]|uniref:Stress-response A/B barrel domain-containing protein At5g22580-like n=2 Tax=Punica granatum TaxID=22663 RepID=A0A6P8CQY7_PUNGR|nr:stress-response A/B barrel domain-containing protein At5g22580-like [Punica granatum]PKI36371.1 hypothetical protein CRG98_043233 [Punica granatum]